MNRKFWHLGALYQVNGDDAFVRLLVQQELQGGAGSGPLVCVRGAGTRQLLPGSGGGASSEHRLGVGLLLLHKARNLYNSNSCSLFSQ
jgi:hypothetical protein